MRARTRSEINLPTRPLSKNRVSIVELQPKPLWLDAADIANSVDSVEIMVGICNHYGVEIKPGASMRKLEDVTGESLRELREKQGQTQTEFWGKIFVKKSAGAYYEAGRSPMPDLVKQACYLQFACGINLRMKNPKKAAKLLKESGLND